MLKIHPRTYTGRDWRRAAIYTTSLLLVGTFAHERSNRSTSEELTLTRSALAAELPQPVETFQEPLTGTYDCRRVERELAAHAQLEEGADRSHLTQRWYLQDLHTRLHCE